MADFELRSALDSVMLRGGGRAPTQEEQNRIAHCMSKLGVRSKKSTFMRADGSSFVLQESDRKNVDHEWRTWIQTGYVGRSLINNENMLQIPDERVVHLIDFLNEHLFMRKFGSVFPPTEMTNGYAVMKVEGANSYRWGENTTDTNSVSAGLVQFTPNHMTTLLKISQKLIAMPNVDDLLTEALGAGLLDALEAGYISGSGLGEPLGIFSTSDISGFSLSNSTSALSVDSLIEAKFSLPSKYLRNAQWVVNPDLVAALALLTDSAGQYILSMGDGNENDYLLGKPILYSDYAPSAVGAGLPAMIIGDLSQYFIGDVYEFGVQRLKERFLVSDGAIGFLCRYEGDGVIARPNAFARVDFAAS